ncbi:ABC transporter permease [Intrasporangium sp.]|uniref:ABC transporter permease n=1 Tax=Intrasporangium sp. TaxID=1925024 RepID=UPI00293A52DB|nr:ABC transporter permease [Intrasporangium sp.]MDV3222030.1 ABC transporter permease [Intrasporangium sp.]
MTTATLTPTHPAQPKRRRAGRSFRALLASEVRLFLRDPGAVFFGLAFPTVLLVGVGFIIPGMREPITDLPAPWAGRQPVHIFLPVVLATAAATVALSTLPVFLATYREQGVLRRLSTTPMRPQGVLAAQLVINVGALVAAAALGVTVAALVFGAPAPAQPVVALLAFVLAAAAIFGVGLIIAAVATKGSTASGIGSLVLFPMMVFAGVWTPGPMMPEGLADVSVYTPVGAGSQALTTAWFSADFPLTAVLVMVAYSVLLFPVAAKLFRWR